MDFSETRERMNDKRAELPTLDLSECNNKDSGPCFNRTSSGKCKAKEQCGEADE